MPAAAAANGRRSIGRTLAIVAAALVAVLGLLVLLGYTVLPSVARDKLQEIATRELGRPTTIERIEVQPFRLAATVHNLVVAEPGGADALLKVDRIEVDASIASLYKWAPIIDALRIVNPQLRVARVAPNRYSIQDLIDRVVDAPPGPTPEFSVNNIELVGGRIDFDDRPMRRSHRVEQLAIGIPFLSSLPYDATINVQPKLAAIVNGSRFALAGTSTPFAQTREASLDIDLDTLPVPAYLDYLPVKLRVAVAEGKLTTRLKLTFTQPQQGAPTVGLAGNAVLDGLVVKRRDGAALASAQSIAAAIERVDPSARRVVFSRISVQRPDATLRRLGNGDVEVASGLLEADAAPSASPDAPWRIDVGEATVADGTLRIEDTSVTPAYRAIWNGIALRATSLSSAKDAKGRLEGSFAIDDRASATVATDLVLSPLTLRGRFDVKGADLARLYPYAAAALAVEVQRGRVDAGMTFELLTAPRFSLHFADGRAALLDTALAAPGERDPLWRVPEITLEGIDVDVGGRTVTIGSMLAKRPVLRIRRDERGDWNYARLLRTTAATGVGAQPASHAGTADDTWQVVFTRAGVEQGSIAVEDRVPSPAVALKLSDFNVTTENMGNGRGRRGTVNLRTRVGERGRLAMRGPVATNPFSAQVRIDANAIALAPLRTYVEARSNIALVDGQVGGVGTLNLVPGADDSLAASWTGDVTLTDVHVLDRPTSSDLVKWRTLTLTGLRAQSEPVQVSVEALSLREFYARVIVLPDATLNLAHLADEPDAAPATKPDPRAPAAATVAAKGGAVSRAAESTQRTLRRVADGALPFAIGHIELAGGNVNFTDNFIRPNYSANLTGVAGTVSAMSPTQSGDIAITAKVDDAAPVAVSGRLQPFARELTLDLVGRASDIELPPLSPYSAKYAGYGITKGKLSFDVAYKVENRKLDARNRMVLDQLTFGERVESPDATKLPVLLAVALLKDTSGRIDIELPISGTLDDPHFSVFGLIVRVIVNLIAKAATAPFTLLAHALGGGGEELSHVEFAPGSAAVAPDMQGKLDKLGRALADRPSLKVEISGDVEPAADRRALEQSAVETAMRNARVKSSGAGASSGSAAQDAPMSADERLRWLTAAYREAPIKERPRNAIGMLKEVPPADMEAMLIAHAAIDDKAVADLGLRRAQAAKDALAQRGVAVERLFLVAPKAADSAHAGAARVAFALR